MENRKIYLAVLNITTWVGTSFNAEHVYGHLILSIQESVSVDNLTDWNVKYLGENIEITQPLTLEIALSLDKKDGYGNTYQKCFKSMQENPGYFMGEDEHYSRTNRFDTFEQVVNAGIAKWKELDIDCPFISLYENEKYWNIGRESASTVILEYKNNK